MSNCVARLGIRKKLRYVESRGAFRRLPGLEQAALPKALAQTPCPEEVTQR
jgi:hypothetical protein